MEVIYFNQQLFFITDCDLDKQRYASHNNWCAVVPVIYLWRRHLFSI